MTSLVPLNVGNRVRVKRGTWSYDGTVDVIQGVRYAVKNDGDGWTRWYNRNELRKMPDRKEG